MKIVKINSLYSLITNKILNYEKILFILNISNIIELQIKKTMAIYEYGNPITEQVILVPSGQEIPEDYVIVGICTYGEAWWTPTEICTYEAITRTAMEDARKIGATLVYVAHVKEPSIWGSSCYKITVHFYKKE